MMTGKVLVVAVMGCLALFPGMAAADRMQDRMNAGLKRLDDRVARIDALIAEQKRKMAQKPASAPQQTSSNGAGK